MAGERERPLQRIAEAFEGLAETVRLETVAVAVAPFSRACSQVSVLFGCLGFVFRFAERDYVSKVDDLLDASRAIATLPYLIDLDVQNNRVRQPGSHSRNLLRVKRGLDMVRVLFEQILASEGNSLRNPASVAYETVFAPHHEWFIQRAVAAGMYTLPTKAQLLRTLNEDEASARVQMQRYVGASATVIRHVEQLFITRGLDIDW